MKKILLIYILLLAKVSCFGQSSYYSNPYSSSLYVNPSHAISISTPKTLRVSSNYRRLIQREGENIDSRYLELNNQINQLDIEEYGIKAAIGSYLNQNVQGIGRLKNTEGCLILAVNFTINKNKDVSNYFNFGLGPGFYSRSVDFENFIFNDMLVSGSATSTQTQSFEQNRKVDVDLNTGGSFGRSVNKGEKEEHLLVGISAFNLNQKASYNLLSTNSSDNFIRFCLSGFYELNLIQGSGYTAYRHKVHFISNNQGAYRQTELGYKFFVNFYVTEGGNTKDEGLEFGLSYRYVTPFRNLIDYRANYLVGSLGFISNKNFTVGLVYDSQIGSFNNPTRYNGVFEVYFTKKFFKVRRSEDNLFCPNF